MRTKRQGTSGFEPSLRARAEGGGSKPIESITFNYSRIEWTYYAEKEEGGAGGSAVAKWDVSLNKSA